MSYYELHQAEPGFHGRHVFLRYAQSGNAAHFTLTGSRDSLENVATVFLPQSKRDALREACDAFNAVMDRVDGKASRENEELEEVF